MEALVALAVAERDIRALSTARTDRARSATTLRREPASRVALLPVRPVVALLRRATRASPFQSARDSICRGGHRTSHVETASAAYISWWT